MTSKLPSSFLDCEEIAAPCSYPLRHRSKAKRQMRRDLWQKSKSRVCGLNGSPLEANLITGWKWGRPAKRQFLFLPMTKFKTPFEAIGWRARFISRTVWVSKVETPK